MHTTRTTPRARRAVAISFALVAALAACGGDDDGGGDGGGTSDSEQADSSADDPALRMVRVTSCLRSSEFEVTEEADMDPAVTLPDDYRSSVGIVETITVGSRATGAKGIGSVTVYETADQAAEADDAAAGFRAEGVIGGADGVVAYDYVVTAGDAEVPGTACLRCVEG